MSVQWCKTRSIVSLLWITICEWQTGIVLAVASANISTLLTGAAVHPMILCWKVKKFFDLKKAPVWNIIQSYFYNTKIKILVDSKLRDRYFSLESLKSSSPRHRWTSSILTFMAPIQRGPNHSIHTGKISTTPSTIWSEKKTLFSTDEKLFSNLGNEGKQIFIYVGT